MRTRLGTWTVLGLVFAAIAYGIAINAADACEATAICIQGEK